MAKANTKATTMAALNSINDKENKHKLDMRKLQLYENLYNYRFDNSGRAINMNPLFNPNLPNVFNRGEDPNVEYFYSSNGEVVGYRMKESAKNASAVVSGLPDSVSSPSLATPKYFPTENTDLKLFDKYDNYQEPGPEEFIPYNPEYKLIEKQRNGDNS